MKTNLIPPVILLAASLTGTSLALTPIKERFTGGTIDPARWYQYGVGTAKMTQAKGLLNFVVPSNSTHDALASLELLTSQPGFNESWQMTLDLADITNADQGTGIGFMIFNTADRSDYLYVEFFGPKGVAAGALVNGKEATKRLSTKVGLANGSIRVRFDSSTKLMTFSVSLTDPAAAYKWVKIGTFSPTGKTGNVNANWNMNASGRFGIQLFAFSDAKVVKPGKLTLDNFVLSAVP